MKRKIEVTAEGQIINAQTIYGQDYGIPGIEIDDPEVENKDLLELYYYSGNGVVKRPPMSCALDKTRIAADGTEVATLSGLPDPCTVTLKDPENKMVSVEVTGGTETIDTGLVGEHVIEVSAFPHLCWKGSFDGY